VLDQFCVCRFIKKEPAFLRPSDAHPASKSFQACDKFGEPTLFFWRTGVGPIKGSQESECLRATIVPAAERAPEALHVIDVRFGQPAGAPCRL